MIYCYPFWNYCKFSSWVKGWIFFEINSMFKPITLKIKIIKKNYFVEKTFLCNRALDCTISYLYFENIFSLLWRKNFKTSFGRKTNPKSLPFGRKTPKILWMQAYNSKMLSYGTTEDLENLGARNLLKELNSAVDVLVTDERSMEIGP